MSTKLKILYFLSLFFAALALGPALAHLLELPNKIGLPREDYRTVQQIYRGWALLGIVVFSALLSTLTLTLALRRRTGFKLALVAFLCLSGTQAIFWKFTYPANQETNNWTMLPPNWSELRMRWELSHAASAGLNLLAMTFLISSLLERASPDGRRYIRRPLYPASHPVSFARTPRARV
jgi:hypothetical protein